MSSYVVHIVGVGDDGAFGWSPEAASFVAQADVLVGGERQQAFVSSFAGERIVLKSGLTEVVGKIEALRGAKRVTVLASGDPLFFGIASYLAKKLGREAVRIHPHISSLQLAFAEMGESWQDAKLESVHGRPLQGLAQRIDGHAKIALLTDGKNTPAAIADYLLTFGMTEYEAFVGERLGGPEQRCGWWTLADLADATFDPLSIVVLLRRGDAPPRRDGFGFDDEAFDQRKPEKGLITKKEVRVISLSELRLREDSVVWDIGAGSGSVAVECARLAPKGRVFAIEKNEADMDNIERNRLKFRADFTAIRAKAPEGLETLPDPDAVFIGGSGGELRELLRQCCARLRPDGRIVVNAATIETLAETCKGLKEEGFEPSVTLVSVSRSKPILDMTRFEALNPIYVIAGERAIDVADTKGEDRA
ncbi:precorrin-6y C5,15-methyltransferase (decarboxylating) subunit CbiE [Paenibacillus sp. TRM 82003]|nr:precorrin-6y C5,15-methyltransferase (decarboxylating) subunit CbiE [Paenibacillus sp. TRM 82003]